MPLKKPRIPRPHANVAFLQRTIGLLRYNADFLKGE
jgi:hypothetical protein